MEAAELVKPRKSEQEEEPPNAPPQPAQQQKGPKPKAKQAQAKAAQLGQAAAAGQAVPRKAVATSLKASAAPHAQLGGSASLSRATSNLSQSSGASGTPTFAQQQLAEARAAAATARAQLAAARGGHGGGSVSAAAARVASAAGPRAWGSGQQLARPGSGASAASSSVWTGAASAALDAAETDSEEGEEQQPPPPPRAPTPDFSQEAWPDLGGAPQPATHGRGSSSSSREAASWAQQADQEAAGAGFGVADAIAPEQQEGYLSMLAAMEAEERHWHGQQQQQQPPAWDASAQPGWDAQHAQQPGWDASAQPGWVAQHAQQPGWAAHYVPPPPPPPAVEAVGASRPAAQPAAFEEGWEDADGGKVDAASLAALLRQQQQAFQRQLAAGQSGWEQPAAGQPGSQVPASVPQAVPSLWEPPVSPAAAVAVPAQQGGSLWDQNTAAVAAQPAPLLPPAPAPAPAAPAWDSLGAAAAALMPEDWAQAATAATFAGYAVQSAKIAKAHLVAVQQEQPQPAAWEQAAAQPAEWAQPAAAAAFAGYGLQPGRVPAFLAAAEADTGQNAAPSGGMPADTAFAAAVAPSDLWAAAAAPAVTQQPDAQAEVDELMQLLGIA